MIDFFRGPKRLLLACGVLLAMTVGGCGTAAGSDDARHAQTASEHGAQSGDHLDRGGALPSKHVHGVARNPADGRVYLATHDGLFRIGNDDPPVRVGPVIDLMSFTVAGPNHFYASGHPGPGVNLPNPVGLLESNDGGQTWTPLSRQGVSDFHSLASSGAGVVGFDGRQLAATDDGRAWRQLSAPVQPHAVAVSPDGAVLVVTSREGLARSPDRGQTWQRVETAVIVQLVMWAGGSTVVAVAADGQVAISTDAGTTWQVQGSVRTAPQALAAYRGADDMLEVLVVTGTGIVRSTDNAKTFLPYSG